MNRLTDSFMKNKNKEIVKNIKWNDLKNENNLKEKQQILKMNEWSK